MLKIVLSSFVHDNKKGISSKHKHIYKLYSYDIEL